MRFVIAMALSVIMLGALGGNVSRADPAVPAWVPLTAAPPQERAVPPAAPALPLWERTLYKTLTYQATSNVSDLALFAVIFGGSGTTGATFFAVNAATAAIAYYSFDYLWERFLPPEGERTAGELAAKTLAYRAVTAVRNVGLGLGFGGDAAASALFVAGNIVTDTTIYLSNEAVWDAFRPVAPRR